MNKEYLRNICIGICVLVAVGLALFSYVQVHQLTQVKIERENQEKDLSALKSEIARLERSNHRLEKEQNDLSKFFFDEQDVVLFLSAISQYAREASIAVVDTKTKPVYQISIPNEKQDVGYINLSLNKPDFKKQREDELKKVLVLTAVPLEIQASGTFASIVKFIASLQNNKHLINVVSVEIHSSAEYPLLDCQLALRIYRITTLAELNKQ